jgi:uncharacterized protein (TIGR02001 family)
MHSRYLAAMIGGAFVFSLAGHAQAQDAASGPTVTGNVAGVSDYVFRGLTQSWGRPAIQGGADLSLSGGFAAGTWASSISDRTYPGASTELDLYASYGTPFADDWSWRVGVYAYTYSGGNLDQVGLDSRSFDTTEVNVAISWKMFTIKYNRSLTDYFAVDTEQGYRGDSKGTGYLQLDATVPLADAWGLSLHAAHTDYATELVAPLASGTRNPGYNDFGATVKYQFATHWSASLALTQASNDAFYRRTASFRNAADTRNVGGTRGFVMLQGTF